MARAIIEITDPEGVRESRCNFSSGSSYFLPVEDARALITTGRAFCVEVPDQSDLSEPERAALEASLKG